MAKKKSAFLDQMEQQYQARERAARMFTIQQCHDIMLIAAHEEFGFGAERVHRLAMAFSRTFAEYANIVLTDEKDDKEIWQARDKLDNALQRACGEYFVPFDERYK